MGGFFWFVIYIEILHFFMKRMKDFLDIFFVDF